MPTFHINQEDLPKIAILISKIKSGIVTINTEEERRKTVDFLNKKRNRRRKRIHKCYFPNCENDAIRNSHSISNKLMLEPISENKLVYTLGADTFKGNRTIEKKPIKEISTFSGFCSEHENIFSFEKKGVLENVGDFRLQLFRTICRHLHLVEFEIDNIDEYKEELLSIVKNKLEGWYYENRIKTNKEVVCEFIVEEFFGFLSTAKEQRKKDFNFTQKTWYKYALMNSDNKRDLIFIEEYFSVNKMLPIALSGAALFENCKRDKIGTPNFEEMYYINIFPNKKKTTIYIAAPVTQKEKVNHLNIEIQENTEKFIIDIMTQKVDMWALKPSFWEGLHFSKRKEIMDLIKIGAKLD